MAKNKDMLAMPVRDFLAAVAAKTPTPGGGSVAAVVGALAAALGEMSLNFTRGKKSFAAYEQFYGALAGRLAKAHAMFEDLLADDVSAYGLYNEATKLADGPEKDQAVQLALAAAINVPRELAKLCLAMLADLLSLADKCNPWLISDLVAAAALARAAVSLSDYNVRVNVVNLTDKQAGADIRSASAADLARARQMHEAIEAAAVKHMP